MTDITDENGIETRGGIETEDLAEATKVDSINKATTLDGVIVQGGKDTISGADKVTKETLEVTGREAEVTGTEVEEPDNIEGAN